MGWLYLKDFDWLAALAMILWALRRPRILQSLKTWQFSGSHEMRDSGLSGEVSGAVRFVLKILKSLLNLTDVTAGGCWDFNASRFWYAISGPEIGQDFMKRRHMAQWIKAHELVTVYRIVQIETVTLFRIASSACIAITKSWSMSMAWCKTAVTPLRWSYCSHALNHHYLYPSIQSWEYSIACRALKVGPQKAPPAPGWRF